MCSCSFCFISSFRINESYDSYVWPLPFHLKQQNFGCTVMTLQVITLCNSLWSDCAQDTSELISQFLRRKPHVWAALLRHSLRLSPDLGEFSQVTRVEFLASLGIHRCWRNIQVWKRYFFGGLISRWLLHQAWIPYLALSDQEIPQGAGDATIKQPC